MLTIDALRQRLHYDLDSGIFTRISTSGGAVKGTVAGSVDAEGYIVIRVSRKHYKAHRLAFLYMTGSWPAAQVDHINRVRGDNRWINLRQATNGENHQNIVGARGHSTSGALGASWHKSLGLWQAQIQVNKKKVALGYYKTKQDAHVAYIVAKKKLHPYSTLGML